MGAANSMIANTSHAAGTRSGFALTGPERDARIAELRDGHLELHFCEIDSAGRLVFVVVAHSLDNSYWDNPEYRWEIRIPQTEILMRQFVPASE